MTRVLVIEDRNDMRAVTCTMLQVNRFDVVEAASAAAGLKAFADGRFDVVIVDILLQGRDGLRRHRDLAGPRSRFARCCRLGADVA
jgi:DNA-binding response OmpR family regulator